MGATHSKRHSMYEYCFNLLPAFKNSQVFKQDNVWISFYEGLHQHSALMLSLLSSTFNTTENLFKYKSLTTKYFKEQNLANFVNEMETPQVRLSEIFQKWIDAPMITKTFRVRGLVKKRMQWTKNWTQSTRFY